MKECENSTRKIHISSNFILTLFYCFTKDIACLHYDDQSANSVQGNKQPTSWKLYKIHKTNCRWCDKRKFFFRMRIKSVKRSGAMNPPILNLVITKMWADGLLYHQAGSWLCRPADLDPSERRKIFLSRNRTRNLLLPGTEPRHHTDLQLLKAWLVWL